MKYIFDVDERNNKFQIRLELQKGNAFNASAYQIIECSEESPNWPISLEILLVDIIDNMRLTVQERNEAYRNSNILVQYLHLIKGTKKPLPVYLFLGYTPLQETLWGPWTLNIFRLCKVMMSHPLE